MTEIPRPSEAVQALDRSLSADLDRLREQGLYHALRVLESPQGHEVTIAGQRLINLSSNNYLGLNTHPRLVDAAVEGARKWGAGTGAVRTIAGTQSVHQELEARLAAFKRTQAALVFQSGYTVNVGVLSSLLEEGDVVVSDKLNHASIIDGIRLTKADRILYEHCDLDDAERALAQAQAKGYRRILLVTDGVFSMDGDIAPLPGLVERAERHGAAVMVDDAHATGVLGDHGRGSTDHFGLHGRVALNIGTLSKAVGVVGGYVAASQTPITPVMCGEAPIATQLSDLLMERGVFAQAIGFPTVPLGKARVRTIVTATHTGEELDRALDAFADAGRRLGLLRA